jgi:hypothetical protein
MIKMSSGLHVKYPSFFPILMTLDFSGQFFLNTQISNFIKIRPVGAELRTDGRTDRHDKANIHFSQLFERS